MTKTFEEILTRIKQLKTKDQLIESMEAVKKSLINQVNKTKEEVQKAAKKIYNAIDQESWKMTRRTIQFPVQQLKKTNVKIEVELKPQVCTCLTLKASRVSSTTNTIKPAYEIRINSEIKETTYEKVSKGVLFKNVRWLPSIDLGNKKVPNGFKRYNFETSMTNLQGWKYEQERRIKRYVNKGIVTLAQIREVKYKAPSKEIEEKENYIELINRRIKGAKQLNYHYDTIYDQAVAGIKTLEVLQKENENLEKKIEGKVQLLKGLNQKTTENIKNNKAKISKLKSEITDLKNKKKKNIKEYKDTKQWVSNARQKTHYWEKRSNMINEAADKINNMRKSAINQINNKKREAYHKIQHAGMENNIMVNFQGIGSGIGE